MAENTLAANMAACQRCGSNFEPYRSSQKNCAPCQYAVRIEANKLRRRKIAAAAGKIPRPTSCIDCGVPISDETGFHRCPSCWLVAKKERNRQREARLRREKGVPLVGDIMPCKGCGVSIVRTTGPKKFCESCAKAKALEAHREASRRSDRNRAPRVRCPIQRKAIAKRYYDRHPKRRQTPKYKVDHRMRAGVQQAIRKNKAGRSWETLVGYSLEALMLHLERQFAPGMSWANMGDWHIDHILPLAGFSYRSAEDTEFRAAWALTNLRPLWSSENQSKGASRTLLI